MAVNLSRSLRLVFVLAGAATLLVALHLWSSQSLVTKWAPTGAHPEIVQAPIDSFPEVEYPEPPPEVFSNVTSDPTPVEIGVPLVDSVDEPAVNWKTPPCSMLEGGDDVQVIMRTGATEIADKLPGHLNTTFQCYSNVVIFSDFGEKFHGHTVHDVFKHMDKNIVATNSDFALYRRLVKNGRQGLDESELSGTNSFGDSPSGKPENEGWRLDKWKFLSMANMTLHLHPNKAWYVFVETDTYVVWSNLMQWLPNLDPSRPWYFGSEVMSGRDLFAHGGSAFVLSRPALQKIADVYNTRTKEWNDITAGHWAGDAVLGRALHEAGTDLTYTWPMFQGGNPNLMTFLEYKGGERVLWLAPALSYHHMTGDEVLDLWNFEQEWISTHHHEGDDGIFRPQQWMASVVRHGDVFNQLILPQLARERAGWNNTSPDHEPDTFGLGLDECREICEAKADCVQYASGPRGCFLGTSAARGRPHTGAESGWIVNRISQWARGQDERTGKRDWILP